MIPEKDNQEDTNSENSSAVVIDLAESDESKQEKPLETSSEKGEHQDDANGNANDEQREPESRANDHGDDDDLEGAPTSWKKRLKREQRAKIEARAAAARTEQENEELRRELEETRRTRRADPPSTADIDAKVTVKQTELAKAIEDGDSGKQAALQTEILGLQAEKTARLTGPRRASESREREDTSDRRETRSKGPTPAGKAFVAANSWWDDPDHSVERSAIVALDQQLIREGSDPNSEAHYERIARRAKAKGLRVKINMPFEDRSMRDDDDFDDNDSGRNGRDVRRERRSAPMGGNGNSRGRVNSEVRDARAGKIVITDGDKETMRKFKLDPDNASHVRAFAESRRDRILTEAQS